MVTLLTEVPATVGTVNDPLVAPAAIFTGDETIVATLVLLLVTVTFMPPAGAGP
jgi:hypothetical protein